MSSDLRRRKLRVGAELQRRRRGQQQGASSSNEQPELHSVRAFSSNDEFRQHDENNDEQTHEHNMNLRRKPKPTTLQPSLDPYVGRLERFELFSTNQCYYLIACDRSNVCYRVLKMDRTLIERPPEEVYGTHSHNNNNTPTARRATSSEAAAGGATTDQGNTTTNTTTPRAALEQAAHTAKPTLRPLSEFLTEDPHIYSQEEIEDMLDMIHHGNRFMLGSDGGGTPGEANSSSSGGLKPIVKAHGIVGFIRFLDCYYLTLITKRAKVGSIGGNGVYTIKSTETFPLKPAEKLPGQSGDADHNNADPSSMFLSMWNRGKRSVGVGLTNREIAELRYQGLFQVMDLTKNFYFSYTYDLTQSLQENFLATTAQPFPPPPITDMYAWNYFMTRELEECTNSLTSYHWIMPIIHGAFIQRKICDYGRSLDLILIARRSRHFAGTRYLKRGVNEQGKVGNDVEHEQIIHDDSTTGGAFASYLQVRGSIPIYWTQEGSVTMPKPPIELNRVDPTYRATQRHFEDLLKRYGSPIVVLDLVKQSEKREREVRVGNEFRHAIDHINTSIDEAHKIRYCALDYSHISKHRNLDVSTSLNEVSTWSLNQTGFFCSTPRWKITESGQIEPFSDKDKSRAKFLTEELGFPVFPMEQKGVLRTNCIDCLDRTNVAQFSAGVKALEQQLVVMGIRSSSKLDSSSNIIRVLIEMYVEIGDHIALQYGGSEAHKKVSTERSESSITGPIGKHKELLTSIRRYYSNAFTDRLKQDAMNLLLGYYVPYHTVPLWEMETDYYLHNQYGTDSNSMKAYERAFGFEWSDVDGRDERSPTVTPNLRMRKRIEASRPKATRNTDTSGEAWRIERVRERCGAQNKVLSAWWKVAIQANIQKRMWMKLGHSASESLLPPRFERLYQPDRLTHFDRFFARDWTIPVRRSHSAQHASDSDDETEMTEYRRTISGKVLPLPLTLSQSDREDSFTSAAGSIAEAAIGEATIKDFIKEYGLSPRVAPSLNKYVKHFEEKGQATSNAEDSVEYIGSPGKVQEPSDDYIKYVTFSSVAPAHERTSAFDEFRKCLHDTSLDSNDVEGIRKLAESAHIGEQIQEGPYRGLSQRESAVEVTTVVHEQLNVLTKLRLRGDMGAGFPLVDAELQRRGVCTDGVKKTVASGWEQQIAAEQLYAEILDDSSATCRRSDLTSEDSLRLYASFFDDASPMTQLDMTYMLGQTPSIATPAKIETTSDSKEEPTSTRIFVERAARLGISIPSNDDIKRQKSAPLFSFERRQGIPAGFEQINDSLFARKQNKFMVFNGAGIDSWQCTRPVTKVCGVEEDVLLQ